MLGQVLLDKITVLAGFNAKFTYDFEGESYLRDMVENKQGGLLVGAHIGNWEVAGQLLRRLEAPINIVMYDAEHKQIKEAFKEIDKNRFANFILIKEDFSHLFKIKEAFARKELVIMHGDRFLPGTNTVEAEFLGKKAKFPSGPLYLSSKHGVPVSFVYALKESATHYHFYATEGKAYPYPSKIKTRKSEIQAMVEDYVSSLEKVVKKYPIQWFNYYPFWELN